MSKRDIRYCVSCQPYIEQESQQEGCHKTYKPVPFRGEYIILSFVLLKELVLRRLVAEFVGRHYNKGLFSYAVRKVEGR